MPRLVADITAIPGLARQAVIRLVALGLLTYLALAPTIGALHLAFGSQLHSYDPQLGRFVDVEVVALDEGERTWLEHGDGWSRPEYASVLYESCGTGNLFLASSCLDHARGSLLYTNLVQAEACFLVGCQFRPIALLTIAPKTSPPRLSA